MGYCRCLLGLMIQFTVFLYLFCIWFYGLSVGAAWIAGQDRSMWRTLRPSAGQAQQWVSEWVRIKWWWWRPTVNIDFMIHYTMCLKKYTPWYLTITSANVDRFSQFFHSLIPRKILCVCTTKMSTTHATCRYTTLWKLKIQKCSWFWQHP